MIQQAPGYMVVSSACDNYLNVFMSLRLYLLVDQKSFDHYSERYSRLFLLLKGNILHALVFQLPFQRTTQAVCRLLENLDLSGNLDSDLGLGLASLLDIYSS